MKRLNVGVGARTLRRQNAIALSSDAVMTSLRDSVIKAKCLNTGLLHGGMPSLAQGAQQRRATLPTSLCGIHVHCGCFDTTPPHNSRLCHRNISAAHLNHAESTLPSGSLCAPYTMRTGRSQGRVSLWLPHLSIERVGPSLSVSAAPPAHYWSAQRSALSIQAPCCNCRWVQA